MTQASNLRAATLGVAALLLASLASAATLSGSATYRERIVLPPAAVFEASLLDISRADTAATVLGVARLDPAGNPPFNFAIEYDPAAIQPGHRYSVRATIRNDGRLLFVTDTLTPVLDPADAAPPNLLMRKTWDGAPAQANSSLDTLPASFEGALPCADCAGTRWHLDLLSDHSYRLRISYDGKPATSSYDEIGSWSLSGKPPVLHLKNSQGEPTRFALTEAGQLKKLDSAGKPIESAHNYSLARLPAFTAIEPSLALSGLYRFDADAGVIELCGTGQKLPVASEGDNTSLERAYLAARKEPGAAVMVSVEGRISERPPAEGTGARTSLIVDRFDQILPATRCAGTPAAAGPRSLLDTYWKLVRLGDTPVVTAEHQREPHFVLHAAQTRLSGSGGCNRLTGGFTQKGDSLAFNPVASTMMACVAGMEQEQVFLVALKKVARWKIDGSQLVLLDAASTPLARFEAVALH